MQLLVRFAINRLYTISKYNPLSPQSCDSSGRNGVTQVRSVFGAYNNAVFAEGAWVLGIGTEGGLWVGYF